MNTAQKKTQTKKKRTTVVLSVLLVAVIALGATLAFLWDRTETEENVFTFAENVKAKLTEPKWEPENGLNLTPGKVLEKDPQITNTSENGVTEYAAIKLSWENGAGDLIDDKIKRNIKGEPDAGGMTDMERLMSLIEIKWSNNWSIQEGTLTSKEQVWVYDKELPQGVTSDPIFYTITIKENITPEQQAWLAGNYGHESTCYTAKAHQDKDGEGNTICTPYYWHHEQCALRSGTATEDQIKATAGKGTVGGKVCDCETVTVHEETCPSLIKTLTGSCSHTTIQSGLGNFTIKVEGAVVQNDTFATFAEAVTALISLFN